MVKVGISGQPLNSNGTSPRANPQVSKMNNNGMNTYAVIVENGVTRKQALDLEQKITDKHYVRNGKMPSPYHQKPTPKSHTKEQFKKNYGVNHNHSVKGKRY